MIPIKIEPYVTDKGGVVVLNGPFPIHQAERVRALCEASPELLACLKALMDWTNSEGFMPEGLEDRVNTCIAKAEGRIR